MYINKYVVSLSGFWLESAMSTLHVSFLQKSVKNSVVVGAVTLSMVANED